MNAGRWPANVILSPGAARALDGQSGYQRDGVATGRNRDGGQVSNKIYGARKKDTNDMTYGSGGGASRYFLEAWYGQEELEWIYSVGLRPYGTERQ